MPQGEKAEWKAIIQTTRSVESSGFRWRRSLGLELCDVLY